MQCASVGSPQYTRRPEVDFSGPPRLSSDEGGLTDVEYGSVWARQRGS